MVKIQQTEPINIRNSNQQKNVEISESISTGQDVEKATSSRFICKEVKERFVDLITKRNFSMKQAAKKVNMSYSTAKKIYRRFRAANLAKNSSRIPQGRTQATYLQVTEGRAKSIPIICLIAGNVQKC